jgi:hypothetical protein
MKNHSAQTFQCWIPFIGCIIVFMGICGCVQHISTSADNYSPGSSSIEMHMQTPMVTLSVQPEMTSSSAVPPANPVPPGTGSLTIWCPPSACSVYIDRMYVGDTPPGWGSFTTSVKSGYHTVKITKIGYEDYTQDVYISDGRSQTITANLSEKSFPYYTINPTLTRTEPDY